MKNARKFVLGAVLVAMVLSFVGCQFTIEEVEKEGQLEITLYVPESSKEVYNVEFDKKKMIFLDDDNSCFWMYSSNEVPVVMYSLDGNVIWVDEDMDGYETIFNGKFTIRETNKK